MNSAISLIMNSWPIILGAAFLIAIKAIKGRKQQILIRYNGLNGFDAVNQHDLRITPNPIKDMLLMEGVNPQSDSELNEACSRLGIIHTSNLRMLPSLLRKNRYCRIRVSWESQNPVERSLHTLSFTSGILLSFVLDKGIEVV